MPCQSQCIVFIGLLILPSYERKYLLFSKIINLDIEEKLQKK